MEIISNFLTKSGSNFASHYINLSGIDHDATSQLLSINADKYCHVDNSGLVRGVVADVANSPFDFRQSKPIGRDINHDNQQLHQANGYDHPFMLNLKSNHTNSHPDATLVDPISSRRLEVYTQEKFIVFYSGNYLPVPRSGICLETQNVPNAINLDWALDKSIYSPNNPYNSSTIWKFLVAS